MDAAGTVRAYYDAVRDGEPLSPFFRDGETVVKFGVGETLTGYEAVRAGLREQTETTTGWLLESNDLTVGSEAGSAWFADRVFMTWTDTAADVHHEFDTRWSGSLLRADGEWSFTGMHVSVPVRDPTGGR